VSRYAQVLRCLQERLWEIVFIRNSSLEVQLPYHSLEPIEAPISKVPQEGKQFSWSHLSFVRKGIPKRQILPNPWKDY
jgi:hypothetical protein